MNDDTHEWQKVTGLPTGDRDYFWKGRIRYDETTQLTVYGIYDARAKRWQWAGTDKFPGVSAVFDVEIMYVIDVPKVVSYYCPFCETTQETRLLRDIDFKLDRIHGASMSLCRLYALQKSAEHEIALIQSQQ